MAQNEAIPETGTKIDGIDELKLRQDDVWLSPSRSENSMRRSKFFSFLISKIPFWTSGRERQGGMHLAQSVNSLPSMRRISSPLKSDTDFIKAQRFTTAVCTDTATEIYGTPSQRVPLPNFQLVQDELINLETNYISWLADVTLGIFGYCCQHDDVFNPKELHLAYSCFHSMLKIHTQLLSDMKEISVSSAFLRKGNELEEIYISYCYKMPAIQEILDSWKSNPIQYEYLQEAVQMSLNKDLFIILNSKQTMLTIPIQHICRYPLVLERLVKFQEVTFAQMHSEVYIDAPGALGISRKIVENVNSAQGTVENLHNIVRLQQQIINPETLQDRNLLPRNHVCYYEGRAVMRNRGDKIRIYMLLCNADIICCQCTKYGLLVIHVVNMVIPLTSEITGRTKDPHFGPVNRGWKVYHADINYNGMQNWLFFEHCEREEELRKAFVDLRSTSSCPSSSAIEYTNKAIAIRLSAMIYKNPEEIDTPVEKKRGVWRSNRVYELMKNKPGNSIFYT